MFRSIAFEQLRSFVAPVRVEFGRKLTLLYGYNNAGKSALLRGLVLAAASCHPRRVALGVPLELSHPAARAATFAELVSRSAPAKRLVIRLGWDDADVAYEIREVVDAGQSVGSPWIMKWWSDRPGFQFDWDLNTEQQPIYSNGTQSTRLEFSGLLPQPAEHAAMRARLEAWGPSVHWLPPTRPPLPTRTPPATGRATYDALNPLAYLEGLALDHPVLNDIQRGLSEIAKVQLDISRDASGVYARVAPISLPGHLVPLTSVGEGLVQVLPVLSLAAAAHHGELGPEPIVAIEQPELHLHPAAELALVNVLLRATEGSGRLVLETHSETLLLGLQLAVAEGRLAGDDVRVWWVDRTDEAGSSVRPVELREDGSRDGWPPGVFSEHLEQARGILAARERRSARGPRRS